MKQKIQLLALFLLVYISVSNSYGNNSILLQGLPAIEHFDRYCYGSASENWTINQTPDGFMYFGNSRGLLEYDGANWKIYYTENFAEIRAISIDNNGRIYVGTPKEFGYFEPDGYGNLVYTSLTSLYKIENCGMIMDIFQHNNATYFLSFHGQIYKYNGKNIIQLKVPQLFKKFKGFLIDDNFLLYSIEAGLAIIKNDTVYRYHTELFENTTRALAVLPCGKNKVSIATNEGLIYIFDLSQHQPLDYVKSNQTTIKKVAFEKLKNPINNTFYYQLIKGKYPEIIGKSDIYHGYNLLRGENSYSTLENGLFIIDTVGRVLNHLHNKRGLTSNVIFCSFEDRELNLWITTEQGTSLVSKNYDVRIFNKATGIEGEIRASLYADNKLFIGTSNGLYLIKKTDPDFLFPNNPLLLKKNLIVLKLLKHTHNNQPGMIICSLMGIYFYNFNDNSFNIIFDRFSIYGVEEYPLNTDILFISHPSGISIIRKYFTNSFKFNDLGLISEEVNDFSDIKFDSEGRLFISTYYSGLMTVKFNDINNFYNNNFTKYNTEHGLPRNDQNKWFIHQNEILIATISGVYKVDNKNNIGTDKLRFIPFTEINQQLKPGDLAITEILIRGNELIVGTEHGGLYYFDIVTNKLIKDYSNKIKKDGITKLYIDDFNRLHVITTNKELIIIDETFIEPVEFAPQLFFRKIRIGNDSIPVTEKNIQLADFSFSKNKLLIQVSSPCFSGSEDIIFIFRLDKDGKELIKQSSTDSKFFHPYLPSGKYTLTVESTINDKKCEELLLQFNILPPWYRAWYAWVIYGIIAIIIIFSLVRFFLRKNIRQRKELQELLNEQENIYYHIAENSSELIWMLEPYTFRYMFVNGACYELFGYTKEERENLTFDEFCPPEEAEKIYKLLNETFEKFRKTKIPITETIETLQYHKDGRLIAVEVSARIVEINKGKIRFIGTTRSIQGKKDSEEAFKKLAYQHQFVADNTKDTFWIGDLKTGKYTFICGACYEMYGLTKAEYLQSKLTDVLTHQGQKELKQFIKDYSRKYYETGVQQNFKHETQIKRKDGSIIWVEALIQLIPDENGELVTITGTTRNIDERKKSDLASIESERKLTLIANNTKDVFWIVDYETQMFTFISGAYYELFGLTNKQVLKMKMMDFFTDETKKESEKILQKEITYYNETGRIRNFTHELQMYHKNGNLFWVDVSLQFVADNSGELSQIVGVTRKIEERKKAEAELLESQSKFHLISDYTKDVFWIADFKTMVFTFITGAYYEIHGFTFDEFMQGMRIIDVLTPESKKISEELYYNIVKKYQETGIVDSVTHECQTVHKDGRLIWIEVTMQTVIDKKGKPTQIIGVSRNIEERKKAEAALKDSEKNFRLISEYTKDVFWIADFKTFKYTFITGAYYELYGYTYEDFMQTKITDSLSTEGKGKAAELTQNAISKFKETGTVEPVKIEWQIVRKDGNLIWVETILQLVTDHNNEPFQIVAVVRNIEKRKSAEKALIDSERNLKLIIDYTEDAFWIVDINTFKFTFITGGFEELFGYSYQEFIETLRITDLMTIKSKRDGVEMFQTVVKQYQITGEVKSDIREWQIIHKNGKTTWIESAINIVIGQNNKPSHLIGISRNIEARKKVEKEYIENDTKLKLITKTIKEIFWIVDFKTFKFNFIAGAYEELYGYKYQELMQLQRFTDIFTTESKKSSEELLKKVLREFEETGKVNDINQEWQIKHKDGRLSWVEASMQLEVDSNTGQLQIIGIVRYIEDRKKTEKALLETQSYFKLVSDYTKDIFWIYDWQEQKYTFISGACFEMYGYTIEERKLLTFKELFSPSDNERINGIISDNIKKYYETGETLIQYEAQQYRKDGSLIWIETVSQLVPDENGKITQLVGVTRNIEERKQAELAFEEIERKYQFIFENTKEVIFIQNLENSKITFIGGATLEIFGFDSKNNAKFLENKVTYDFIVPEYVEKVTSMSEHFSNRFYETGEPAKYQYKAQIFRIDGSKFWAEVSMQLVPDETGKLTQAVGILREIGERENKKSE